MSIRSDPLDELSIPDGTHVEEHDLVTEGDVIVGGQSTVEFGVRGHDVIAGERVKFGGDIEAEGDCRLDMWCDVAGNVLVGQDAYLGERVHVAGQLMVSGDLDIGDDVDIEEGFEANGWIVIRNPMPTIVFLFVYLQQLLRIGEEEAAEDTLNEFMNDEREHDPVIIPRGSSVSDDAWRVSTPGRIGSDCRIHGNIRATSLDVGEDTEVFGSLRAKEDVRVASGAVIHGDVTTRGGTVTVERGAHVRGDVSCEDLRLHDDAEVDGAIRARGEVSIERAEGEEEAEPEDVVQDAESGAGEDGGDEAPEDDEEPTPWADLDPAIERVEEPTPWVDLEPAITRAADPDAGKDVETEDGDGQQDLAEIIADAEER